MTTETEITVNIPVLRRAVEWVERQAKKPTDQSQWNQGSWAYFEGTGDPETAECGTAFCVAGKIVHDAGYRFAWTRLGGDFQGVRIGKESWRADDVIIPNADGLGNPGMRAVRSVASEILGINGMSYDAAELFYSSATARQIREVAERIAGQPL